MSKHLKDLPLELVNYNTVIAVVQHSEQNRVNVVQEGKVVQDSATNVVHVVQDPKANVIKKLQESINIMEKKPVDDDFIQELCDKCHQPSESFKEEHVWETGETKKLCPNCRPKKK